MKYLYLVVAILLLNGCVSLNQEKTRPIEKVGTWCESADKGKTCYGYTTYRKDGTAENFTQLPEYGIGTNARAEWWHQGDQSRFKFTYQYFYDLTTRKEIEIEKLQSFCNTIISIGRSEFTYENSDGEQVTMYRVIKPLE